jgi:hypothetical protein
MGNRLDIKGYLSELLEKRKIALENRDKKFLFEMFNQPEHVRNLHRIINKRYEWRLPPEDGGNTSQGSDTLEDTVYYITSGPLTRPAILKRIKKLVSYGLIEPVDKKSRTKKEFFDANLRRAKLFKVTEYGLFCVLSQETLYPSGLFLRHWKSKGVRTLLSPYFEKKTFDRMTTEMYFTLVRFLHEACSITIERLNAIEQAKKENDGAECQEQIIRGLEDDLLWHAKSFALRLFVDSASKDKEKSEESRRKLSFLAHDKKFVKLVIDTMHEILSYYGGGRLLELDKSLHP